MVFKCILNSCKDIFNITLGVTLAEFLIEKIKKGEYIEKKNVKN